MINNIRLRFVILSTLSMALVFALLVGGINLVRYKAVIDKADTRLEILASQSDAVIVGTWFDQTGGDDMQKIVVSKYLSVMVDTEGEVRMPPVRSLYPLDKDQIRDFAYEALLGTKTGFIEDYRYLAEKERSGTRIMFYDCSEGLKEFRNFRDMSIMVGYTGLLLGFVVIDLMSEFTVKPVSESYEKHKSFITNASHEIKTPLAIINADATLLEESLGEESEWAEDIRNQIKKLTDLTNDLVLLSKIVERHGSTKKQETDLTSLVRDTVFSFRAQAIAEEKRYDCDLESGIRINTDRAMVRQIMSILLDNAMKYSKERIQVRLRLQEKAALITVTNDTVARITQEDLAHMFDRFYRSDASRSLGTSGHGLGLSIARAACDNIGGKISAQRSGEDSLTLAVTIPVK